MTVQALFDIDGDGEDYGFNATASDTISLTLRSHQNVSSVYFQIWDPDVFVTTDPIATNPPFQSKNAEALTLVGATSGALVSPVTVTDPVTVTLTTGVKSWIIRCVVNGGYRNGKIEPGYIWERLVALRVGVLRSPVATERTQYDKHGMAGAVDDLMQTIASGDLTSTIDPLSRILFVDGATSTLTPLQSGSSAAPFKTIQQALDETTSSSAWTIIAVANTYTEALTIGTNKKITLKGFNADLTVQVGTVTVAAGASLDIDGMTVGAVSLAGDGAELTTHNGVTGAVTTTAGGSPVSVSTSGGSVLASVDLSNRTGSPIQLVDSTCSGNLTGGVIVLVDSAAGLVTSDSAIVQSRNSNLSDVVFVGSAGVWHTDAVSKYNFDQAAGAITNGTFVLTEYSIAATASNDGYMTAAYAAKLDATLIVAATASNDGYMTQAYAAKLDGIAAGAAALSNSTPSAVGTAAAGVGATASRYDHVHAHGNQASDGSMHALVVSSGAAGFMSGADKAILDGLVLRTLTAGAGLTGGGTLAADRTFDVVANADGSIVVNANDIQVGVLATDAQHGNRGNGSLHTVATGSVAGFMSAADKTKFDAIATPIGQTNGVVPYIASSAIVYSTTLKIISGTSLTFGTNPSSSGALNFAHQTLMLAGRNSANGADVDVMRWGGAGNKILFGQTTVVAGYQFDAATGASLSVLFNGNTHFSVNETLISAGTKPIQDVVDPTNAQDAATKAYVDARTAGALSNPADDNKIIYGLAGVWTKSSNIKTDGSTYISIGATVGSTGNVRVANNTTIVMAKTSGGTDMTVLSTDGSNQVNIGDGTNTVTLFANAATSFRITAGGLIWSFNSTGVQPASNSDYTWQHSSSSSTGTGFSTIFKGLDKTGSGAGTHQGGPLVLTAGSATGATATHKGGTWQGGGGSATGASGSRTGGITWLSIGTGATQDGNTYFGKTDPASYNFQSMGAGYVFESSSAAPTGDPTTGVFFYVTSGSPIYRLASGTTFTLNVSGTVEYTFSGTTADFKDNVLQFSASPAQSGTIRFGMGSTPLVVRNAAGSGDINIIDTSGDLITFGSASANEVRYNTKTGTTHTFQINTSTVATISGTALTLALGGTAAATGSMRVAHGFSVKGLINAGGTDATLWSFGVVATDRLLIGGSTGLSGLIYDTPTSTTHDWRINNTSLLTLGSATIDFKALTSLYGTNPAGTGNIRWPNSFSIAGRNALNTLDASLLTWSSSNVLSLGQGTVVAHMRLDIATGGTFFIGVNNVDEYTFSSTVADFTNNILRFTTATGTGPSVSSITVRHGQAFLGGRLNDDSAYAAIAVWGATTDHLDFGATNVAGIDFNIKTASTYIFRINNTIEYTFSATSIDMSTNVLTFGTTPATAGSIRVGHATDVIDGRNSANSTDIALFRWGVDATNMLTLGDSNLANISFRVATGGVAEIRVNGTVEYTFSSTVFDVKDNVISFGTGAAAAGAIRLQNAQTINYRNGAGSADIQALNLSSGDELQFGSTNQPANMRFDVATSGVFGFYVNATLEYSFSSTIADFTNNSIQIGTNPATTGTFRVAHGFSLYGRNNANSANRRVIAWGDGTTNVINIGDDNDVAGVAFRLASGNLSLDIASGTEYSFSSTTANFKDNVLTFGTNPAAQGTIRLANGTGVYFRNAANSADILGILCDSSNELLFGITDRPSGYVFDAATSGTYDYRVNNTTEYSYSSTTSDWKGNAMAGLGNTTFFDQTTTVKMPDSSTAGTGSALTLQGQVRSASTGTNVGGAVTLAAGDATGATATHTGGALTLQAGSATGGSGTRNGGTVTISPGTGATADGSVRINANAASILEVAYIDNARKVVALCLGSNISATQVPTSAGSGVVYIGFAATDPVVGSANPSGGGLLWCAGDGSLNWKASTGTITILGPGGPYCQRCGSDFVKGWRSAKHGHLTVCLKCLVGALEKRGVSEDEWVVEKKAAA